MDNQIRKARLDDREAIQQLIAASARSLSRNYYQNAQIEAAVETVFGVDSDLIKDGTYFVVESDERLAGCGGWSKRRNLFGGDQYPDRQTEMLDPLSEPAKIRAFFVHPEHARKGIARMILECCEREAKEGGFSSLELMATLPGIPFYEAAGYEAGERFDLDMGHGVQLELMQMRKEL
jgi:GNAT superfamily N-acetyltransferase